MKFDGILNNAMAGFYRSAYTDEEGNKKFMFSSQCEVLSLSQITQLIYYRPAMHVESYHGTICQVPTKRGSFDEPALKATFASTLIIPSHLTALSNMPVISEKPFTDGAKKGKGPISEDLKRVEFETTPVMSTYVAPLFYFVTNNSFWHMRLASLSTLRRSQKQPGTMANAFLSECTPPRDLFPKGNSD